MLRIEILKTPLKGLNIDTTAKKEVRISLLIALPKPLLFAIFSTCSEPVSLLCLLFFLPFKSKKEGREINLYLLSYTLLIVILIISLSICVGDDDTEGGTRTHTPRGIAF